MRLVQAHVDLARAEFSDIADEVKRIVGFGAFALALVLFALMLLLIGLPLFLADWLLGSMGWGVLIGVLLALALAVTAVAGALGARGRASGMAILAGLATALVVSLLLGSDAAYNAAGELVARGEPALRVDLPPGWDRLVAGAVGGAVVGAVMLLLVGLVRRGSVRSALGLFVDGLIVGAVLGAIFGVTRYGWQVGTGIGITVGLLLWIVVAGTVIAGLDVGTRFERLAPTVTIATARETWEWVRARIRLATR